MSHVCFTKARRYCLLFLAALFLCACAAGAEEASVPPVSQAESASSAQESSHTPSESFASSPGESSEEVTSEDSAEDSSAEESMDESSYDESSEEASLPEPTPPADATLTPAGEFKVGNDGSFIYGICCSRTAFPAEINTPVVHGVDDQGEIYAFWNQQVIRLSDGASFSHHSQVCEAQILFCGGDLYLLFTDNTVQRYDLTKVSIGNGMYYTTGNINPDVGHQSFTVGLDCSAFVCAAWEFVDSGSGTDEPYHWSAPYHLTKYGHQVSSVYDMKEMDIFLKPGDNAHVMFFACLGPNNTVGVYEVTSLVLPEKTVFRFVDMNKLWDYIFLHLYQTYTTNANTHQKTCDSCGYAIGGARNHTFSGGKCTTCGYKK